MTSTRGLIAVAILFTACAPIPAQWLKLSDRRSYENAGRIAKSEAPTPRTRDGKPDFSGMWGPEKNRPCPPDGCPDMAVGQEFYDIGWGLKGGLPYRPWARDLVKERKIRDGRDDPDSRCLPVGVVRLHTHPLFKKIVQVPGLIVILNEREAMYRQIFTDGRPLPVDPQPSFNGYSTGKWEGDTLVVQSNGFREGLWLDRKGSPLTEAGKITERFHRVDFGRLEIQVTVDDPKAYTAPWTVKLNQFIVLDTELMDYFCMENEKDYAHMMGK